MNDRSVALVWAGGTLMLHEGLAWFVCPEGSILPRTDLGGHSLAVPHKALVFFVL